MRLPRDYGEDDHALAVRLIVDVTCSGAAQAAEHL
jgi:hypothetical protein